MSKTASQCCVLCGRNPKRGTTAHHLIPRTCHSNKWFKKRFSREQMLETVDVCRDCHKAIHRLIPDEKQLGRHFHTLESLRSHVELSKFLVWVKRQK